MTSLSVSLIWLLSLLGAAAHLRDSDRSTSSALSAALAFAAMVPLASWLSPQPNWVSVLIGIAAVWRLIAGPWRRGSGAIAGVCAGLAAALVAAGGIAAWQAVAVTAAALGGALALRSSRKGGGVRHELLLVVVALATPAVGLAGDLVFGWHSAGMLNQEAASLEFETVPGWAVGIVGASLLAGLVRGLWIKR